MEALIQNMTVSDVMLLIGFTAYIVRSEVRSRNNRTEINRLEKQIKDEKAGFLNCFGELKGEVKTINLSLSHLIGLLEGKGVVSDNG